MCSLNFSGSNADFAHARQHLVDVDVPDAAGIRVVLDNLSTHTAAARRVAARLECHDTPKPASWLNIAELELAVLTRQCLGRRLATQDVLAREVAARESGRNVAEAGMTWRFTTADARRKLARLDPKLA